MAHPTRDVPGPGATTELCLIDANISSLRNVPLSQSIQVLNLHCNQISQIENIQHLVNLRHLDLSSNQIVRIEGLGSLVNLRTLNLACNLIRVVDGLQGLRSLSRINISYNQVEDISGFRQLSGSGYRLSHVELHGNQLTSINHVVQCLMGCTHLTDLTLMHDGKGNPVCSAPDYRETVLSLVPQVQVLDGRDRGGRPAAREALTDIPGLEEYLEYLLSSDTTFDEEKDLGPLEAAFPRIEAALQQFRRRPVTTPEVTTTSTDVDVSPVQRAGGQASEPRAKVTGRGRLSVDHEVRLETLEHQLAHLMYAGKTQPRKTSSSSPQERQDSTQERRPTRQPAKRDVDHTDESDTEAGPGRRRKERKMKTAGRSTATSRRREELARQQKGQTSEEQRKGGTSTSSPPSDTSRPTAVAVSMRAPHPRDVESDKQFLELMRELDSERERRWKAEQAAKRLADQVKTLQEKGSEEQELQAVALQATSRLKQALMNERETRGKLQDQLDALKEQFGGTVKKLGTAEKAEEDQRRALQAMEETAARRETDRLQQLAHEAKKTQEAQMKASASQRELDLVRHSLQQHKDQIQALQALLAEREQDHRKELAGRFSMNSKEFQEVLAREVAKEERRHSQELKSQQQRIETLTKQYADLEDEFRMALQIEASRFREVQEAFENATGEASRYRAAMVSAQDKEKKVSTMVQELTAMVKEQKGRITELSKSRQEALRDLRERNQTLETQLEEARRRLPAVEVMRQDKVRLQSQLTAQESIIEGLRAEKKLWSQELAQQGASLAQDRGRLEAKIEALTAEVSLLKKQNERDNDALKIKTKMLEDQTDTIRKLKEGLGERDEEVKKAREEALKVQRDLESRLTEETTHSQDLQEKVGQLTERKEQLKQQLSDTQEELEENRKALNVLDRKWRDKGQLIGTLETQVRQAKENFDAKEKKLQEERKRAMEAEKEALERLRRADDAFRKQLEAKVAAHEDDLERAVQEKQEEIDRANQRVLQVEQEMRELLRETENNKKMTEERVKKLNKAFYELQQGLT
ncbi:leucine-rich repeat and coiled-coil domain-containing protein 1-like [Branchiostoma floridae]|uniref:Leucine-rich repeat and coiled-coil domain-containing protein 1 n=1 Tax=Branchiostoma floridae TaxID=7739 RepID=A0A9J7MVL7_BRAFL|nr:leucine-rich repeat and coiled-coil domain-containing protein 1-like [Branchiostoma floridae]XP_035680269.1 leucine-rich repeat and coiled-coil domain-containing protein 1-like [Branchiostoma floridae]